MGLPQSPMYEGVFLSKKFGPGVKKTLAHVGETCGK